jgi:hypothetical protein
MDKYSVLGVDGTVDVAASANAYAKALTAWKAENEVPSETIEAAVEAVFDRNPGRLPMPVLLSFATQELGATPETFRALHDRIHAYVVGQSAKNTGRIDIAKGVKGGVARLSRPGEEVPEREAKKTA